MKQFFILTLVTMALFTSCKKDNASDHKNDSHTVTNNTVTTSTISSGRYEGSILGYEVFNVNLKADHSATITKAKAKDNAVTSIGTWEQNGNIVKVKTDRFEDYFYVTDNSLVKMTSPTGTPSDEIMKSNRLEKK